MTAKFLVLKEILRKQSYFIVFEHKEKILLQSLAVRYNTITR